MIRVCQKSGSSKLVHQESGSSKSVHQKFGSLKSVHWKSCSEFRVMSIYPQIFLWLTGAGALCCACNPNKMAFN
jgi:hypothetical protein